MRKYHIHIKCESEGELKEELRECAYILTALRDAEIKRAEGFISYSVANNTIREYRKQADEWISKHKTFIDGKK